MEQKQKERKAQAKRGLWKPEEDLILKNYVETHGEGNWATVSKRSGLKRGGKSCRLRWKNYLRPNIKRGGMSKEEEDLIIRMHKLLGNRWSLIAGRLPGRTDNEVKNYWNTHLNKKSVIGKRKTTDSNKQEIVNNMEKEKEPPTQSYQPNLDIDIDMEKKQVKEESTTSLITERTWMERAVECFNYDNLYDCEMMNYYSHNNNNNLVFDEQPFTPYLDSFLLFEAFGTAADSDHVGIQSFLPLD